MVNINKIKSCAKEKGISLTFICTQMGVGKTYFIDVQKRNSDIPPDRLQVIADILNTTPEYLTDQTDKKEKPTVKYSELSKIEMEFVEIIQSVPPEKQEAFLELLRNASKIL